MKQLIAHVQKSVYDPVYYRELLAKPFSFSWKYYSALSLSLALLITIASSVPWVGKVNELLARLPERVYMYYPDDLTIEVRQGELSSNVVEPYFLPMPPALHKLSPQVSVENLAVIDTVTPFSLTQFKDYHALAWLSHDQIAFLDSNGAIKIQPIDKKVNLTMNEDALHTFMPKVAPYFKFVPPLLVLAVFCAFLIFFGFNFIYLLFAALLIMLLGVLMKEKWSYGTSYRLGLHAITLPLLLNFLLMMTPLSFAAIPFLFTAILLTVVYVNFKNSVRLVTPEPSTPPSAFTDDVTG